MQDGKLRNILSALGIQVSRRSRDWLESPCPFAPYTHRNGRDHNPSFGALINGTGVSAYKCQACGMHGRMSSLVRALEHYRRTLYPGLAMEADVADLQVDFGEFETPTIDRMPPTPLNQNAYHDIFPHALEHAESRDYLQERGIHEMSARALEIMYDPSERRVVFPVYGDSREELYGFTGRAIYPGVEPKVRDYAGLPKRHLLLGEHLVEEGKPLWVVEGIFGWAWLAQEYHDLISVVALMGAQMTPEKAQRIAVHDAMTYLVLDNDSGGDNGLFGAIGPHGGRIGGGAVDMLVKHVPIKVPSWPEGKDDPDQLGRDDVLRMLECERYIN